ncbi:MAG: T9SS type A sorting domain-containing protein [Chitinivibrionia bacterium]|nr:T9SS type A sorting domain-containing protein [Chitinivibrionia bacterium]
MNAFKFLFLFTAMSAISLFAEFGKTPFGWGDFRFGLVSNGLPYNPTVPLSFDTRRLKVATEELGIKIAYRYRYVNEGVDPRENACVNLFPWAWDNNYSKKAKELAGVESAYVIYVLQEEGGRTKLLANMNDPEKSRLFFWTLQKVAENANGYGSTIIVEPDTWGYFLQDANNSSVGWNGLEVDPTKIPAKVNNLESFTINDSSVIRPNPNAPWETDTMVTQKTISFEYLSDLPNTMAGFGVAIIRTMHKFAPDCYVGFLASHWSVNLPGWSEKGLAWSSPELIDASAQANVEFFSKMYGFSDPAITLKSGDRADFIGVEKNGWCAGEYEVKKNNTDWYWDDAGMEKYLAWTKKIAQGLDLPVIGWQISIGNMDNPNVANGSQFANAWKDTFFPYFFNNVNKFIDAGFIGFLVGKGLAEGTDYTLPSENIGEKGWFFNQLIEFDKNRPYYTKSDEIEGGGSDTKILSPNTDAKIAGKSANSVVASVSAKGLNISLPSLGNANVFVYNVSGKIVYKTTINKSATIPVDNFKRGVYFVKTEFYGKNFVSKILLK